MPVLYLENSYPPNQAFVPADETLRRIIGRTVSFADDDRVEFFFDPSISESDRERYEKLIQSDDLVAHYQPQVNLNSQDFLGVIYVYSKSGAGS